MTDLDLGMNNWMSDPVRTPTKPIEPRQGAHGRGSRPASAASSATRTSTATASATARSRAPIIPRPPTSRAAPATPTPRPTPRTPHDWQNNMDRLTRKFDTARQLVPAPVVESEGAESRHHRLRLERPGRREARDILTFHPAWPNAELPARPRAAPVRRGAEFIANKRRLPRRTEPRRADGLDPHGRVPRARHENRSVLHYNGLPIDAQSVVDGILKEQG
jgi:2-oxoglutarate/2-oxoacid ferredoxin oxidoreductase subunit alpha